MSARSKARKRALDVLYAADARGVDPSLVLGERLADREAVPLGDYAEELVRGYAEHHDRIDDLIAEHAEGWTLARMPAVDRSILRIATYELAYRVDVPPAVAVDEAVELAKSLSTDNSPRFVNGVLGDIALLASRLRRP
ncbi:transcription antitermination factor NusB [Nakamurella endophytica]|uniref:Transcription antitermination protein NusB n=1 Tax=Nakamurella endophytica TaxID=1748367 RepID=A0A917SLY8_9ACTN|nr:transcription antitermination factor NusB [Nakamurella endophytica]GGL86293.1 N utilization substance protein B [Nakamurella endophytica]